jgi:hypothetical protein
MSAYPVRFRSFLIFSQESAVQHRNAFAISAALAGMLFPQVALAGMPELQTMGQPNKLARSRRRRANLQ